MNTQTYNGSCRFACATAGGYCRKRRAPWPEQVQVSRWDIHENYPAVADHAKSRSTGADRVAQTNNRNDHRLSVSWLAAGRCAAARTYVIGEIFKGIYAAVFVPAEQA